MGRDDPQDGSAVRIWLDPRAVIPGRMVRPAERRGFPGLRAPYLYSRRVSRHARPRPPFPRHVLAGGALVVVNLVALVAMFAASQASASHARALDRETVEACGARIAGAVDLPGGVVPRYRLTDVRFAGANEIRAHFDWTGSLGSLGDAPRAGMVHCRYSSSGGDLDEQLLIDSAWVEP